MYLGDFDVCSANKKLVFTINFFRNQGILSYFEFTLLRSNLIVTGLLTDFEALTAISHQALGHLAYFKALPGINHLLLSRRFCHSFWH